MFLQLRGKMQRYYFFLTTIGFVRFFPTRDAYGREVPAVQSRRIHVRTARCVCPSCRTRQATTPYSTAHCAVRHPPRCRTAQRLHKNVISAIITAKAERCRTPSALLSLAYRAQGQPCHILRRPNVLDLINASSTQAHRSSTLQRYINYYNPQPRCLTFCTQQVAAFLTKVVLLHTG